MQQERKGGSYTSPGTNNLKLRQEQILLLKAKDSGESNSACGITILLNRNGCFLNRVIF